MCKFGASAVGHDTSLFPPLHAADCGRSTASLQTMLLHVTLAVGPLGTAQKGDNVLVYPIQLYKYRLNYLL